jgi:hypothetical protein
MARNCSVCVHPDRDAIEREMIGLRPYRHMAARFGVSTGALVRHHDDHLSAAVVKASRIGEITRADDLVDRIIVLARETQAILDRAKAAEDDELALKAIARAEKQLELQAKLIGQIKEGATVNITLSVEWLSIRTLIVGALDQYPEARHAVAAALEEVATHALDG